MDHIKRTGAKYTFNKKLSKSGQFRAHLEFESVVFGGFPDHPNVQLYAKIQDGSPQHQPQLQYQTRAIHGVEGESQFEWGVHKSLSFSTSIVSITVFKQQMIWANHLVAVALVSLDDVLAHLLQNPAAEPGMSESGILYLNYNLQHKRCQLYYAIQYFCHRDPLFLTKHQRCYTTIHVNYIPRTGPQGWDFINLGLDTTYKLNGGHHLHLRNMC
ncbi:hypothetical protein BDN72DRAFT_884273, partial [Pluteus cervinus]